ncbi:type I 3-dehydroquinate dehydratase [Candidatus Pyrohabitans sp.]
MARILQRTPAVCASIIEHSVDEFLNTVRLARGADMVELRADGLKFEERNYGAEVKRLLRNARLQTELPIILTVRSEREGGVFPGSEREMADCLKASLKLADAIDVELRMNPELRDEIIQLARSSNVDVIVSCHDFSATPSLEAMRGILEEEVDAGASIAKLAVTARSRRDVVSLLRVTQEMSERLDVPIVTIALGELGRVTRIAAPMLGSAITYGYVTRETAPGQLSVEELKQMLSALGAWNG